MERNEEDREAWNKWMREYRKERKLRDPNWKKELNEYQKAYKVERYKNDPEFRRRMIKLARLALKEKLKKDPEYRNVLNQRLQDKRLDYKESCINMYSNGEAVCKWCGQGDIDVLCLDHVNNDRSKTMDRGTSSTATYLRLRQQDYPEGYQVLCANCNLKKEILRRREFAYAEQW